MRHAALIAAFLCACVCGLARADYLVASRPAIIRASPSSDSDELGRAKTGDALVLTSDLQTDGYYRVRAPAGGHGWVYRTLVRRFAGPAPAGVIGAGAAGDGKLEVHLIDVGQGDAILIRCPDGDHQLLIDAGDTRYPGSAAKFKAYLSRVQKVDDPIEIVVATHPHADHIGSMDWVLREFTVRLYVDNGLTSSTATFGRVAQAWTESGADYWGALDELTPRVDFCPRHDVSAVVIRPGGFGTLSDPNDCSVVVRVDFAEDSFLFVGDAEKRQEAQLLADPAAVSLLDCDFLKVGHHGSETSSSDAFLDAVSPELAAVSCGWRDVGTNKDYMHPRAGPLRRLEARVHKPGGPPRRVQAFDSATGQWTTLSLDGAIYATSAEGDLVFESTGHGIAIRPD